MSGDSDGHSDVYERASGTTTKLSNGNGTSTRTLAAHLGTARGGLRDRGVARRGRHRCRDSTSTSGLRRDHDARLRPAIGRGPELLRDAGCDLRRRHAGVLRHRRAASTPDRHRLEVRRLRALRVHHRRSAPPATAPHDAFFSSISADGTRVFFETAEQVTPATDTDSTFDVYERQGTVSRTSRPGPTGGNGNFIANFAGISQDGLSVFLHSTSSSGAATPTPPRTSSGPRWPGIPARGGDSRCACRWCRPTCSAPPRPRCTGPRPARWTNPDGSCSPPAQVSTNLTVGTPDGGGGAANSSPP